MATKRNKNIQQFRVREELTSAIVDVIWRFKSKTEPEYNHGDISQMDVLMVLSKLITKMGD